MSGDGREVLGGSASVGPETGAEALIQGAGCEIDAARPHDRAAFVVDA
jgi:hypothetical protein